MTSRILRRKQAGPARPCGLAFDEKNGQVVIAEHAASGGFDIYRLMADERRALNVTSGDLRTTLTGGNAHTEQPKLAVTAEEPDASILRAVIAAAEGDPHAFAFSRTRDGRVVVTAAEQSAIDAVVRRTEKWLLEQQPSHAARQEAPTLRVETRTRVIARLWRAGVEAAPGSGTVGFLVISPTDYAVALWSEQTGLVYETEEGFERGADAEIKCLHARDMFAKFIAPPSLAKLKLPPVAAVVVSSAEEYGNRPLLMLKQASQFDGLLVSPVSLKVGGDERDGEMLDQTTAFAIGALLDGEEVPTCNLTESPQALLDQINRAEIEKERAATGRRARAAVLAMLVPFAAAAAFLLACQVYYGHEASGLRAKIDEETQAAGQLKQANADYESSKANFAAFRTLLDNLISLRQRQPATHQLLRDLNGRWPQDPSWYISEINVRGASVEIKGKTRNEQAITVFAKSLEFSDGLFTGILTRNNVQGAGSPGQPQPQQQPGQSSVIEFTVNATYAPLATPGKAPAPAQQVQVASMQQAGAAVKSPAELTPGRMTSAQGVQPPPPMPNLPTPAQNNPTTQQQQQQGAHR